MECCRNGVVENGGPDICGLDNGGPDNGGHDTDRPYGLRNTSLE